MARGKGEEALQSPDTRIEKAPSDSIDSFGDFAYEFIEEVFGINSCMITDQSSLWDFLDCFVKDISEEKVVVLQCIYTTYGVDVSDIESGNLVSILARIKGDCRAKAAEKENADE